MTVPLEFIHPKPLPKLNFTATDGQYSAKIGPMSAARAVEFFWKMKTAAIYGRADVSVYDTESLSYIFDEHITFDISQPTENSALNFEPHARCLSSEIGMISDALNKDRTFAIRGPFYEYEYAPEVDFADREFRYLLDFSLGAGPMVLSTVYMPVTPDTAAYDSLMTAQSFPIEIFGFTIMLHLNVHYSHAYPESSNLVVSYSADAAGTFDFYE